MISEFLKNLKITACNKQHCNNLFADTIYIYNTSNRLFCCKIATMITTMQNHKTPVAKTNVQIQIYVDIENL